MGVHWLLVPAPDWIRLKRLAERYERTGEGEAQVATAFKCTLELVEALTTYAVALAGQPSQV